MKNTNILGALTALFGLLIAVIPNWVLPACQGMLELANGKHTHMRCHYTVSAEMLLGGIVFAAGIMLAFAKSQETYQRLSNLVALLGAVVILTPLYILPTCMNPEMACNLSAKPALIILGGVTLLLGLIGSRPKQEETGSAE